MVDLIIKGATENNLKSIDVVIPSDLATVVVGPSGSGKSSLVFDTIYAEGQRRYIESLSSYARQFLEKIDKPLVESIENISPTIAVEQKNRIKGSRETVGTITEIYDYLRLLFAKVGVIYCPKCKIKVEKATIDHVIDDLLKNFSNKKVYVMFKFSGSTQDLIMAGFVRVLAKGRVYDLSEEGIELPDEYYVVYDRFKISEAETSRLWEAVERASFLGNKECFIYYLDDAKIRAFIFDNVCPSCKMKFNEPDPRLFSFDSPIGACPACRGFGNILKIDENKLAPDPNRSLIDGALEIFNKPSLRHHFYPMINFLRKKGVDINKSFSLLGKEEKRLLYEGGGRGEDRYIGLNYLFEKLERKKYKIYIRVLLNRYKSSYLCNICRGSRLIPSALYVRVGDKNIFELQQMSLKNFYKWLGNLKFSDKESKISKEIMKQLFQRTSFTCDIGLGYLTLDRLAKTLSSGEAQRVNLANQLASSLVDTIYVLDEPSIGLHPRDVDRLIKIIHKLRDNGNKVIVVEHDATVIKSLDHIIELGPQSGDKGGKVVFSGSIYDFLNKSKTLTSHYLNLKKPIGDTNRRKVGTATNFLTLEGLNENNLKDVKLKLPLNRFVCITGVSGSGKSSLITQSLYSILSKNFRKSSEHCVDYRGIEGVDNITDVMLIDQEPIGKSQRSIPITFISGFNYIRDAFSETPLARSRGYVPSHFSFNTSSGQCPSCRGEGFISVDMQFMADIYMKCETCKSTRYKQEILDVQYKGKNINEVLSMTVEEAYDFFISSQPLRNMLKLLIDVGLEYLVIGQPALTLSGGEAQRLKICKELINGCSKKKRSHILYIMDEPTTGLHPHEVEKLLIVLQRIIDDGNSLVVIEHNMDLVKYADYVIDLGPEGGENGGRIISEGTPESVSSSEISYTGKFLKGLIYA